MSDLKKISRSAAAGSVVFVALFMIAGLCTAEWEKRNVDSSPPGGVTATAIGDVFGDERNEIVVGGDGWGLRIYEGAKSDWSYEEVVSGLDILCAIVGDPDNDGEEEIICSTTDLNMLLYEWTELGWAVRTVEHAAPDPVLYVCCGDADNDGKNELIAGTDGGEIYVYEDLGGIWIRATVDARAGRSVTALAVGDPDCDGCEELVAGTSDKRVYIYERREGIWERSTVEENAAPGVASLDIGDMDGDKRAEIAVGTSGRRIYTYSWEDGLWIRETVDANAGGSVQRLNIIDIDGDGWSELAVITNARKRNGSRVTVYEKAPAEWHMEEVDVSVSGEPQTLCAADPDNDGEMELVVGTVKENGLFVYEDFLLGGILRIPETEDIAITWESDPGADYSIYYSNTPYGHFRYATTFRAVAESAEWIDDGTVIPVHPVNVPARYYMIRKLESDVSSNAVGKFTRTFSTEMHLTSLPLIPYSNWIQDVIGTQLTGARGEGYADRVWKWIPETQQFELAWLVDGIGPEYNGRWWCPDPFGPSQMTLDFGEGFFVQCQNGEQNVTFVGALPRGVVHIRSIHPGMQMTGAALAEPVLLDSTDLYESGASGAPSELMADRIWRWDEETLCYKYSWLVDFTGTENDGSWWDSETSKKALTPMMPGYGYWYQGRGDGFFWTFLKPSG